MTPTNIHPEHAVRNPQPVPFLKAEAIMNNATNTPPQAINSAPRLAFTVQEVAEMLAVSPKTIYRLVDRKLLKSCKALRHLRITRQSVEIFLAEASGETLPHSKSGAGKAGGHHNFGIGSCRVAESTTATERKGDLNRVTPSTTPCSNGANGMSAAVDQGQQNRKQ